MQHGRQSPVIIIGGGTHAKVLINMLLISHRQILGYADPDHTRGAILDVTRLGDDQMVFKYHPEEVVLVNGVGSVKSTMLRKKIYDRFSAEGYSFESVIHPSAIIASGVHLSEGVQIMAGAILQPGSDIGVDAIVNTGAIVDHDCMVGAHVHIAPGAVLSGSVRIETGAHIGTGASLIQGVTIGASSVIGAGTVVIEDIPAGVTAVGVPARIVDGAIAKKIG